MQIEEILEKHLIVNDEYEKDLLTRIIKRMSKNISSIYSAVGRESKDAIDDVLNHTDIIEKRINEYVGGVDDTNTGKILLFLSKLPVIANDLCEAIETNSENIPGVNTILARDSVDIYAKKLFLSGYDRLFKYQDRKQIATYLYYESEKFIDALVLEFKQDISHMIDPENLIYDDLYYVRRLIKNKENENTNRVPSECVNCEKNCNRCRTLPEKENLQNELNSYRDMIKALDKKIECDQTGEPFSCDDEKFPSVVKKVLNLVPIKNEHKKIQFKFNPKIFSVISAERFGKILERRYNQEDYIKEKDIYYILYHGIDTSVFSGDELFKTIDEIHDAYVKDEIVDQK